MELFELTKLMFENPQGYLQVTSGDKRKHFFMINRRMSINYPIQTNILQHIKINDIAVIDFWQNFLRKHYNKTPYWMFTKGIKKTSEEKEKNLTIKDSTIKEFCIYYGYDLKSVNESIKIFPEEMKKELNVFEKTIMS
jgi:hypothetical protein